MTIIDGRAWSGRSLEEHRVSTDRPSRGVVPGLRHIATMHGTPHPPPLNVVSDLPPVPARVDHGRWIADCACHAANFVWLDTPLVWCAACGNAASGGRWRRVEWPHRAGRIVELLEARPAEVHRNWSPAETVIDLAAENVRHLGRVEPPRDEVGR